MILPKMSGLSIAESTVERTTEAIGCQLGQALEAKVAFGEARPWDWHHDAEGKTCPTYRSIRPESPSRDRSGVAAEGEMVAVGMVYNPVPEDLPTVGQTEWPAAALAGAIRGQFGGPRGGGRAVASPDGQVGIGQAQRWIALSDGGAGLEDLLRGHFGRVDAVILDFYHASEHLGDFAKAWCSGDAAAVEKEHAEWAHRLKHEGGAAILEWLEGLDIQGSPRARAAWEEVVTYFRNQHHRMEYPSYRAKGWQIGSGPAEAACKTVGWQTDERIGDAVGP